MFAMVHEMRVFLFIILTPKFATTNSMSVCPKLLTGLHDITLFLYREVLTFMGWRSKK